MELKTPVNYDALELLHPDAQPERITELGRQLAEIYIGNPEGRTLAAEIFEQALSRLGLRDGVRGVYVVAGKRSTAKKTLVNSITQVLFGASERRIMINCKTLTTPWSVLRLLDSNILNDGMPQMMPGMPQMRRSPATPLLSEENLRKVRGGSPVDCTIVCLDNFQAAEQYLIHTLQRIFFDGVFGLDYAGATKIDFRNVIFVLLVDTDDTSNTAGLKFGDQNPNESAVRKLLGDLNEHVDGIAICRTFTRSEQKQILSREIDAFAESVMAKLGCTVAVEDCAREFVLDKAAEGKGRGSDVTTSLVRHIIRPINLEELKGNVRKGRTVYVSCPGKDRLAFHVADSAVPSDTADGSTGQLAETRTEAVTGGATTGDVIDESEPRERKRWSISQSFGTQAEAEEWKGKIVGLLEGLPAIDHAEKIKSTVKKPRGFDQWMMRVEFVTSAQGFAAVRKNLPEDWEQGSFVMYS
jgi:hypothetical protein